MYESTDKMVSHPAHYQTSGGLEAINVIEAFTENLRGIEATDTGNVIKYILRWKQKDGVRDLEKVLWYTQHLIDHLKNSKDTDGDRKIEQPGGLPMEDSDEMIGIACLLNTLWFPTKDDAYDLTAKVNTKILNHDKLTVNELMTLLNRSGCPRYDNFGRTDLVNSQITDRTNDFGMWKLELPMPVYLGGNDER